MRPTHGLYFFLSIFLFIVNQSALAGNVGFNSKLTSANSVNEIGTIEEYALAKNRKAVLSQLVPGTRDYYFFHILHYQNTSVNNINQLEKAAQILNEWELAHKRDRNIITEGLQELKNRQALLMYDVEPTQTLKYLKKELGLNFNHFKKRGAKERSYPSNLESNLISTDELSAKLRDRKNGKLDGFTEAGLYKLDTGILSLAQVRELMGRVVSPNFPNIVQLITRDLKGKNSRGFGVYQIHKNLTLAQMNQLRKRVKGLTSNNSFVTSYMKRILPKEVKTSKDHSYRYKKMMQAWEFVSQLPDIHNSLKLHLLYDLLKSGQRINKYNKDLFISYLKIPKYSIFANQQYLNKRGRKIASFNTRTAMQSGFNKISDDSNLVEEYLHNFLVDAKGYSEYLPYLEEKYLKHLFAEVKILNGVGDKKSWFAQLPADKYEELNSRVELKIVPENKSQFKSSDKVELELALKNIDKLMVKVYQINTLNYYKKFSEKVAVSINLDGLEANSEKLIEFSKPSHLLHRFNLSIPEAKESGVYVIDLVGNGINSRAVIDKGGLNFIQKEGVSGHLFRIYNEDNQQVKNGSIWLKGHNYTADKEGRIIVPYSKNAGQQKIIVTAAGISTLHNFYHNAERYQLHAAVLSNKESMIRSNPTEIVVSPQLLLNGKPVNIDVLKNISVEIALLQIPPGDNEILDKKIYTDIKRNKNQDIVIPFDLNADIGIAAYEIKVLAKVENISQSKTDDLEFVFPGLLNSDSYSNKTADAYLRKNSDGYTVEVLGRNGEVVANHSLNFSFKHKQFSRDIKTNLQSDAAGRINLGKLDQIEKVRLHDGNGISRVWDMQKKQADIPNTINAFVGEVLIIPVVNNERLSLFKLADGLYLKDESDKISASSNSIKIKGLKRGQYQLLDGLQRIIVNVTKGVVKNGFILSDKEYMQYSSYQPLFISDISENGLFSKKLQIKLENWDEKTRVHLLGSRFVSEDLSNGYRYKTSALSGLIPVNYGDSKFSSGRRLGDELRYIMERKLSGKYPGNMLKRPSVLIKPLEFGKTSVSGKSFEKGGMWDGESNVEGFASPSFADAKQDYGLSRHFTHDYNFLNDASFILINQTPDKDGLIEIDIKKLAGIQQISVIASNGKDVSYGYYEREQVKIKTRDIRQKQQFADGDHYRQEKSIKSYQDLNKFNGNDKAISQFEIYSSIEKVFALYQTIDSDSDLDKFRFILNWGSLEKSEQLRLYSEYASHELNFYLYQRDIKFFEQVIKPAISNKLKKDFIDEWLLGNDLSRYAQAEKFEQLNVIEKALLAKRVKSQTKSIVTNFKNSLMAKDVDLYKLDRLFALALTGGASSETNVVTGVADDLSIQREIRARSKSKKERKFSRSMKPQAAPMMKQMYMAVGETADFDEEFELEQRAKVKQFYTAPDKTKSWIEQNYYNTLPAKQIKDLVELNGFWIDYAQAKSGKIISRYMAMPSNNLTEMIFALAVLDMPIKDDSFNNAAAKGKGVVYAQLNHKSDSLKQSGNILLGQNIFPKDERYRYIDNRKQENFIQDGFVKGKIYGMQTVLTNTSSVQEVQELFIQIPQGAIPVGNGFFSKSVKVQLDPFATQTIESYFYFPKSGKFNLYPAHSFTAHSSKSGNEMSYAKNIEFTVHADEVIGDKNSWDYISQNGSANQQIEYLKRENTIRLDLNKIAYRYKNKDFYQRFIKVLSNKHRYDATAWSYGIKHNMPQLIAEYLHLNGFASKSGDYLDSSLIKISAIDSGKYLHKEFWPLINKRVFQFGKKRYIDNKQLFEQYNSLLRLLSYKGSIGNSEKLVIAYYLLLQDRVGEAMDWFARIDKSKVAEQIQFDYMAAYLAFYKSDIKQAYSIAERYSGYPIKHWRDMFLDIVSQSKQINADDMEQGSGSGSATATAVDKNRERRMFKFASKDPSLDLKTIDKKVQLRLKNIDSCDLNFYSMDLEVLFSRNPFAMQLSDQFALIKPNLSIVVDKSQDLVEIDIPQELKGKSLLIEANASGVSSSINYYPNTLVAQISKNYGIAKISSAVSNKPLSSVYIKVYAKMKNGDVSFYKDGYTDLRGMFDYLSQNADDLQQIEKFSMLILSVDNGSLIKEAYPPKI